MNTICNYWVESLILYMLDFLHDNKHISILCICLLIFSWVLRVLNHLNDVTAFIDCGNKLIIQVSFYGVARLTFLTFIYTKCCGLLLFFSY